MPRDIFKRLLIIELLQTSGSASVETQQLCTITYKVFRILSDLNPNFMERSILSFSKYNLQKRQF